MTKIGKFLVFVNLALSLTFGFWGYGIYTNRINWTNSKSAEAVGIYATHTAELDQYKKAITPAVQERDLAAADLATWEQRRPLFQTKYNRWLEDLRSQNGPIQAIRYDKGQIAIGPDGYLIPAASTLSSVKVNEEQHASKQKAIADIRAEIARLLQAEQALTDRLIGTNQGKIGGLRGDLAAGELARQHSLDQQEYLRPLLYNRLAEADSLVRRHQALEARLKELETVGVARNP